MGVLRETPEKLVRVGEQAALGGRGGARPGRGPMTHALPEVSHETHRKCSVGRQNVPLKEPAPSGERHPLRMTTCWASHPDDHLPDRPPETPDHPEPPAPAAGPAGQPGSARPCCMRTDGLGAVAEADLGEEVVDVGLDRGLADEQLPRDLRVGQPGGDEGQDLGLALGETIRQVAVLAPGGRYARGRAATRRRGTDGSSCARPRDGIDGLGDLLGAGVLGEVAAGAGLEGGEDGLVVGYVVSTTTARRGARP